MYYVNGVALRWVRDSQIQSETCDPSRGPDYDRLRTRWKCCVRSVKLIAKQEPKCYLSVTMPALVIKSFPEGLHARLRKIAAAHRRSVTQETIHLLETAIAVEEKSPSSAGSGQSKWANRKLLPEYEAMLKTGAFSGGTDSTIALSEERDAR